MSRKIIEPNGVSKRALPEGHGDFLDVSEFYCDTIQGEGINIGAPAAFLRLRGCTLGCVWCDTKEVWCHGDPYTFEEIFSMMEGVDLIRKFKEGQRLVITGGSPLIQQERLVRFISRFIAKYHFKPVIEIENECVLMPDDQLIDMIDVWNNSPKLSNSMNPRRVRYRTEVLEKLSSLNDSWFKFPVRGFRDWGEIEDEYIKPGHIRKDQIILMPIGGSIELLEKNRPEVVWLAVVKNVRYCTREHIVLWNTETGV